jgi:hypothetical protein
VPEKGTHNFEVSLAIAKRVRHVFLDKLLAHQLKVRSMNGMKLLQQALRHALLRRRMTSEQLELSTTLFDQNLQRFDASPASVRVFMSLLHQSRPWSLVGELALCEQVLSVC